MKYRRLAEAALENLMEQDGIDRRLMYQNYPDDFEFERPRNIDVGGYSNDNEVAFVRGNGSPHYQMWDKDEMEDWDWKDHQPPSDRESRLQKISNFAAQRANDKEQKRFEVEKSYLINRIDKLITVTDNEKYIRRLNKLKSKLEVMDKPEIGWMQDLGFLAQDISDYEEYIKSKFGSDVG